MIHKTLQNCMIAVCFGIGLSVLWAKCIRREVRYFGSWKTQE